MLDGKDRPNILCGSVITPEYYCEPVKLTKEEKKSEKRRIMREIIVDAISLGVFYSLSGIVSVVVLHFIVKFW